MSVKVAVREDDSSLRDNILLPELAVRGFKPEGFATPKELYQRTFAHDFEIVVSEVELSDENGTMSQNICKPIRRSVL